MSRSPIDSLLGATGRIPGLEILVAAVAGALVYFRIEHGLGAVIWAVAICVVLNRLRTSAREGGTGLGRAVDGLLVAGGRIPAFELLAAAAMGAFLWFHIENGLGAIVWTLGFVLAVDQMRSESALTARTVDASAGANAAPAVDATAKGAPVA